MGARDKEQKERYFKVQGKEYNSVKALMDHYKIGRNLAQIWIDKGFDRDRNIIRTLYRPNMEGGRYFEEDE